MYYKQNCVKMIKLCSDRHEHGKLKNKYRLKHAVPELGAGAGSAVFKIAPLITTPQRLLLPATTGSG